MVLETGHAIIELRREQDALPDEPCYAESMPWRAAIRDLGRALIRLFGQPDADRQRQALDALERAIDAIRRTDEQRAPDFESSPLRRMLSYLHFIRTTLLDPQSPLRAAEPSQGTIAHAA
ncbi:Fusaric acid resistance protein family protein [compost metagenome]